MNHHKVCITGKIGFDSQKEAEHGGQRSYKCPLCRYYHRSGPILPITNPVLRTDPFYEEDKTTT